VKGTAMTIKTVLPFMAAVGLVAAGPGTARAADLNHVQITTSSPLEGVRWYTQHLECKPIADRTDAVSCGSVDLVFVAQPTMGSTQGTGLNHISFSFGDLAAKAAQLEKAGVRGSAVRLQRFEDGLFIHELPGLFKHGFIFDPWGTRIELVEDPDHLGFHHIHLASANPDATLTWYRNMFGGEPASLKGRQNGLKFGDIWVLVSRHEESTSTANSKGRSIDHVAFVTKEFDKSVADLQQRKVTFLEQPAGGRTAAKHAVLSGPDNLRVEVVEPGFLDVKSERGPAAVTTDTRTPYTTPKTPWGEPDLQGIYTGNSAHGIPLERSRNETDVKKALTPEEAAARRERGTLSSIWGYEREWRDTTLEYAKRAPSTQVAMVVDPPDGRIPPRTQRGQQEGQAAARLASAGDENADRDRDVRPAGPEDLGPYVRCITRGVPGMMMPGVYNNGLEIVQGPGFVAIQKEMIHETRIVPTTPRDRRGPKLTTWLGDSQGRWEGDTLVVETTNFNGRMPYQGSTPNMKLIERFTRVGPNLLEYRFTIDDPATWTKPWTGMFNFDKDDAQYELVEYACHESNYSMTNILNGARVREKAEAAAKTKK